MPGKLGNPDFTAWGRHVDLYVLFLLKKGITSFPSQILTARVGLKTEFASPKPISQLQNMFSSQNWAKKACFRSFFPLKKNCKILCWNVLFLMSEILYLSPLYKMTAKLWPHWNETPQSPTDGNFDRINRFLWNCSILLNQQIQIRAITKLWPYWNIQSWQLPI